ncbi:hypothetical protein SAY87_006649 [Trapa incisa]|uniref:INO80 complex subunit B-like conserved region domain-containing protein n=1 Tax=Trapa incisa TaxID=236973 RepID=A0AAN7K009_9MYRT|nr:hypothetical protein SAY87_006649 [Trapa incisa]
MEEFRSDVVVGAMRRRRSHRRRPNPYSHDEGSEPSPVSPAPQSDDAIKDSSDENINGETSFKRKEFNLNQCVHVSSPAGTDALKSLSNEEDDGRFNAFYNNEHGRVGIISKRSSEGALAPANWKSSGRLNGENHSLGQSGVVPDGLGNENKVKKVKLKVGGVTRTISASNGESEAGTSRRVKQNSQGILDHVNPLSNKRSGLQGIPWKDFSKVGFCFGREESSTGKMTGKNVAGKQGERSEPVRKSRRMPKKRIMEGEFDEDEDDEIRYLEKLKASRISAGNKEFDEDSGRKQRKLASVSDIEQQGTFKAGRDAKRKSRVNSVSEDADYGEEEETGSDGDLEGKKRKKQKKESIDSLMDNNNKREMTLTTRQRAMQSSKDGSVGTGSSLVEFPNGLPPAPPRKQKEKLSEIEQQLKKAEAAQRRKIQNEKAARESEAEAIRKILGQDSSRKKREEKMKKRQEALEEEKAANASLLMSTTIRTVMNSSGTVVIFPSEAALPEFFKTKTCSYPPPREKCAGPSCTNPYKYRDSKTNLPLCSLQCYKAVQQKPPMV